MAVSSVKENGVRISRFLIAAGKQNVNEVQRHSKNDFGI
jgi:hypothetical protein